MALDRGSAMKTTRRTFLTGAAALGAAPAAGSIAWAQTQAPLPRQIKLLVPYAPGGATDILARGTADVLARIWGMQPVVENRPGGATNIGIEAAAKSEPDGSTILVGPQAMVANQFLFKGLKYDPVADFRPVSLLVKLPNVMVVPNSLPAKSVKEFIALAKEKERGLTFASSGLGSSIHLCGELFKRMTGINMTHVAYRGSAPAMNDLIGGRVDVMFDNLPPAFPQVQGGTVRALVVTTPKRVPLLPNVPTLDEAGVPGFDVSTWFGFFVPAKTPDAIVNRFAADARVAMADPGLRQRLEAIGMEVIGSGPDELAAHLKAETEKWGKLIREAEIKGEG